jgi:FkbM family methyltransferase
MSTAQRKTFSRLRQLMLSQLRKLHTAARPTRESSNDMATKNDIYYAFRLILGRPPDAHNWQHYGNMIGHLRAQDVASYLLTSPEFKERDVFQKIMGRYPEEEPVLVDLGEYKQYVTLSDESIGIHIHNSHIWEPNITIVVKKVLKPGMVFIDIGANIGYFSLLAANQIGNEGRVIAFEPNQRNCNLLQLSALVNQFDYIDIYPLAVADTNSMFVFDLADGSNGTLTSEITGTLSADRLSKLMHRTLVRSVRLDDMLSHLDRIDIIKMDVEGAEYRALRGMQTLIQKYHPLIVSEFSPIGLQGVSQVSGEDYLQLLTAYGYHISVIDAYGSLIRCGTDVSAVMHHAKAHAPSHIDIFACAQEDTSTVISLKQTQAATPTEVNPYAAATHIGSPAIYSHFPPPNYDDLQIPTVPNRTSETKLRSCLCTRKQLESPAFRYWTTQMEAHWGLHRKLWEYCYIVQALYERDMIREDRRGLGFAVGTEPLPSLFARLGCEIVATDLHRDDERSAAWEATNEHASCLEELNARGLCEPELFDRQVSFRPVDMNRIPHDLTGFDFTWSSCSFEHCGSIDLGKRFLREQLKCLKPGGIAVHTTEYNLSSDEETIDKGDTVLFRRQDIEAVIRDLQAEGHTVELLQLDIGSDPEDMHVDIFPYSFDPHLKLEVFGQYVTTSIGLIIRKADGDTASGTPATD